MPAGRSHLENTEEEKKRGDGVKEDGELTGGRRGQDRQRASE